MFCQGWKSSHPEPSVCRVSGSVRVLLHFFSLMPSEKMSGRRGGAAWLTSCALVFHRPSQWLPFTEVSVTADLLSHFDLIVASEGA